MRMRARKEPGRSRAKDGGLMLVASESELGDCVSLLAHADMRPAGWLRRCQVAFRCALAGPGDRAIRQ